MPTDTFPLTASTNEGCGAWAKSGAWPPGSGDFANEDNDAGNVTFVSKYSSGGNVGLEMAFYRWDTSAIDDAATITAANLLIYVTSVGDTADNYSLIGGFYDFGGQATVTGDLVETIASPILTVDLGALTTGAVNTIPLTDLSGISKSGVTGIRLGLTSGTPTATNSANIASYSSSNQEARLEVTYTVAAAQTLNPSADSVDGTWTNEADSQTNLYASIDEDTASDTDYIQSVLSPSTSGCRVKLETGGDPASSTGHVIRWRGRKDATGGQTIGLTVKLYQGGGDVQGAGTLIASFTRSNVSNTYTDFAETLSGGEADSITNYADLYLEFFANAT